MGEGLLWIEYFGRETKIASRPLRYQVWVAGKQLAGTELVNGSGSYTSAGGRPNRRGTQVLDLVVAQHILYSVVPTGSPELPFVLRNTFCSPQTSLENGGTTVQSKMYNPCHFGIFTYLLFNHKGVKIDHLKRPS